MRFVSMPGGQGKTLAVVAECRRHPNRFMIVHNAAERKRIIETYRLPPKQVIDWECRDHQLRGLDLRGAWAYIDNIDLILQTELGLPVAMMTARREPPHCPLHPLHEEPCSVCRENLQKAHDPGDMEDGQGTRLGKAKAGHGQTESFDQHSEDRETVGGEDVADE